MSNQAIIDGLSTAKDTAMRMVVRRLIEAYEPVDFVRIYGEELSKHADTVAMRTGDYGRAAELSIIAKHAMALDDAIENYDGADA